MIAAETVIADAAALATAIRDAAPGAVLTLAATEFRLDRSLVLDCAITLRGPDDAWPRLRFTTPDACLAIRANRCTLRNLLLTGDRHRAAPLLEIVGADDVLLAGIALVRARGRGMRAEDCRDLRVEALQAAELDAEAVVAARCTGLAIAGICRETGRAQRAAAILLDDCSGFTLALATEDVSGSAVTIRSDTGTPMQGRLSLDARHCFRALTVIGSREHPTRELTARVGVRDYADCAVALTNVQDVTLDLAVAGDAALALRLDGGFGVRQCRLVMAADHPESDALVEQRGGSRDNTIDRIARAGPAITAPAILSPAVASFTGERLPVEEMEGVCSVCGWRGRFRRTLESPRETFACGSCRATLRYRGQAEALLRVVADGRHASLAALAASGALDGLAIFEPGVTGPLRAYLARAGHYRRSFYEPGLPSGTVRDGVECQDLMATSHPDAAFDLVVTSDILEHVRAPMAAFAEIRRILRPAGAHVFTVPIGAHPTRARVDTSGPLDRHLLPPVHHGSGTGGSSLVYTDFGRDIGIILRAAGMQVEALRHPGPNADEAPAVTIIARRPA